MKWLHAMVQARPSAAVWVVVGAMTWLVLISGAYHVLKREAGDREVVTMGYMPVLTNLACPLLDAASRDHGDLRFEALKFSSFAEMAEALRSGHIEAAFIIAPLSVVLHQQGEGVRVVYIGNRHESTMVVRSDLAAVRFADLAGHTLAVPMRYSGHNLCALRLAAESGLGSQGVRIVEMNPPDMASALATGALDAYVVGEPFAAQTTRTGVARVLLKVEDVWPGFICNLLLVKQSFIDRYPERVRRLVHGAVRSGLWARTNPEAAAVIAASYWNQPVELVEHALTTPPGRVVFDRFVPDEEELAQIAELMLSFGLSDSADVRGLAEPAFAASASTLGITDLQSILSPLPVTDGGSGARDEGTP